MSLTRCYSVPFGLLALLALSVPPFPVIAQTLGKADRILVLKGKRVLELLRGDVVLKSYPIALGRHPRGPKRQRGDGRTPEGDYVIDYRFARTPYHLALHISYPDAADKAHALAAHVRPGGDILIHGMPARFGHTDPVRFFHDWTNGCIAVGNGAIEEIWQAVDDGTPIEIRP
jgi:murein L,D-transpeptidase YafK